jgi:hypothetical protein
MEKLDKGEGTQRSIKPNLQGSVHTTRPHKKANGCVKKLENQFEAHQRKISWQNMGNQKRQNTRNANYPSDRHLNLNINTHRNIKLEGAISQQLEVEKSETQRKPINSFRKNTNKKLIKRDNTMVCNTSNKPNIENRLKFCLVNTRSIRNKTADFTEFISDNDIDLCMVSETWLKAEDDAKRSECQMDGYIFHDQPRNKSNFGGGTAILYKANLKVTKCAGGCMESYEYSEWVINAPRMPIRNVIIYRPPYTKEHPVTGKRFIEQFSDYLETLIICTEELLISGDFNMHVDDPENINANDLLNLLTSFGLKQHVGTKTHISGHILDLIITREASTLITERPRSTYYISDHAFVECTLSLPKPRLMEKHITYRQYKKINLTNFMHDINSSPLGSIGNVNQNNTKDELCQIITTYNKTLSDAINTHAPLKEKS